MRATSSDRREARSRSRNKPGRPPAPRAASNNSSCEGPVVAVDEYHRRHGGYPHRINASRGRAGYLRSRESEQSVPARARRAQLRQKGRERGSIVSRVIVDEHAEVSVLQMVADRGQPDEHRARDRNETCDARRTCGEEARRSNARPPATSDLDARDSARSRNLDRFREALENGARLQHQSKRPIVRQPYCRSGTLPRARPRQPRDVTEGESRDLGRQRQAVRLQKRSGMLQQCRRRGAGQTHGVADAVRLERAAAAERTVVDEHVQQRMPQPSAFRALIVPEDLRRHRFDASTMQAHGRTGGEIDPRAAERGETVRHYLAHRCATMTARAPPLAQVESFLGDRRRRRPKARRN